MKIENNAFILFREKSLIFAARSSTRFQIGFGDQIKQLTPRSLPFRRFKRDLRLVLYSFESDNLRYFRTVSVAKSKIEMRWRFAVKESENC